MGALEYISNFCSTVTTRYKRKTLQTVELKVKIDCDGCERRVKNACKKMKGVKSVDVNRKESRVTVTGFMEPSQVLKRVKRTGKRAEFWSYVPYNLIQHPYVPHVYDKRAPTGFVRNVVPESNPNDEKMAYLFSDDNPNACSIM